MPNVSQILRCIRKPRELGGVQLAGKHVSQSSDRTFQFPTFELRNHTLSVFGPNHSTGQLTEISGSPFEVGGYANSTAIDPNVRSVYAVDSGYIGPLVALLGEDSIRTFDFDSNTGAPPCRADLKGLVEVLHRIEKDAQFLFVAGAMDCRCKELELRQVNPVNCVFFVREYVQYLYEQFSDIAGAGRLTSTCLREL